MFSFTKWLVAPVFAAGLLLAGDASQAEAGGFSISIGNGGYGGGGYGGYGGYGYGGGGYGYNAYRPAYGFGGGHVISPSHSSYYGGGYGGGYGAQYGGGHYDYHPTEVYRHGNHLDVVPGHYDYHRGRHGCGF